MNATSPTVIKKYANRRLYNTGTSAYVTLDDLAEMVKNGEEFEVVDAKTGEDLTRSVLSQIIFEQESKGGNLMPVTFLRQLIQFYGDSMQSVVPAYLDMSLKNFASEQDKFREAVSRTIGSTTANVMEEQIRQNMAMMEKAFQMFTPFAGRSSADTQTDSEKSKAETKTTDAKAKDGEIDELRQQLANMQEQIEKLAGKS